MTLLSCLTRSKCNKPTSTLLLYVDLLSGWTEADCYQQMTRQLTVQYRAELQHLRRKELHNRLGRIGLVSGVSPGIFQRSERDELDAETDRTAAELLRVLQSIPIQVLGE